MFIGHYGPALAGPRFVATVPLWFMCIAVQFMDFLWAAFVLMGIEDFRIEPGFTPMNALDLYHMPWSHSLVMSLFWSVLLGLLWFALAKQQKLAGGLLVGLGVFSHWLTDLLVHTPDLALWPGGPRVGFGWWESPLLTLASEGGLLLLGLLLYLSATSAKGKFGKVSPVIFVLLLFGVMAANHFGPLPGSPRELAVSALGIFSIVSLLAWVMCDRARMVK